MSEATVTRSGLFAWLPNAITGSRIVFGIVLLGGAVWLTLFPRAAIPSSVDLGAALGWCFALGAISDLVDGTVARALKAESDFGARLDPIADKVFGFCALILAVAVSGYALLVVLAGCIIVARDWWVDRLRARSPSVSGLKVSFLAKLKTTLLFVALGFLISGLEPWAAHLTHLSNGGWTYSGAGLPMGVALLWVATCLAVYTGWRYLQSARRSQT